MKHAIISFVFVAMLIIQSTAVMAAEEGVDYYCASTTTLLMNFSQYSSTGATSNYSWPTICDYGCINSTFEGRAMCRSPPKPINQSMFMLFEIVAIGMLMFSMIRGKKAEQNRAEYTYQHGIISLMALVLFFAMSLLTTEVIVVYINWMFAAVSFIWTIYLYAMSMYPDNDNWDKEKLV